MHDLINKATKTYPALWETTQDQLEGWWPYSKFLCYDVTFHTTLKSTFKASWTHDNPVEAHTKGATSLVVFPQIQTLAYKFRPESRKLQHGNNEDNRTVLELFLWHDNKRLRSMEFLFGFLFQWLVFVILLWKWSTWKAVILLSVCWHRLAELPACWRRNSLHTLHEWQYVLQCECICVSVLACFYMWLGIWICETGQIVFT